MRTSIIFFILFGLGLTLNAQNSGGNNETKKATKIGIVISTNDAETVWNAFRFANYAVAEGDSVSIFLLGKGVESPNLSTKDYDITTLMEDFVEAGGALFACGTCLRSRSTEGSALCPMSTMSDLYEIIITNEKIITF